MDICLVGRRAHGIWRTDTLRTYRDAFYTRVLRGAMVLQPGQGDTSPHLGMRSPLQLPGLWRHQRHGDSIPRLRVDAMPGGLQPGWLLLGRATTYMPTPCRVDDAFCPRVAVDATTFTNATDVRNSAAGEHSTFLLSLTAPLP